MQNNFSSSLPQFFLFVFLNIIINSVVFENIQFEAIQNGSKSNRVLQAWTEVSQQIFGG